jgi:uncharacterized protein YdeI (YjbR/CyaY-like superfamily)
MPDNDRSAKVDAFLEREKTWRPEFERLRAILGSSGLEEGLKWGQPCYSLEGANIVLMHGFKGYCALLFFKGALIEDSEGVLIQQTDNVQGARQMRFAGVADIERLGNVITDYVGRAIAVERSGAKVAFRKTSDFAMPEEFRSRLEAEPALRAAFEGLTPGRQRAYLLHFGGAKQATTRAARVEKCVERILAGKGLDD